jgi:transcriptional regulator with XRE-family HTH domain
MAAPDIESRLAKLFGEEVRRFRVERELSQERFAEKLQCSSRYVQQIEAGEAVVSFIFFVTVLALMKEERRQMFLATFLPVVSALRAIQPIRREGSSVGLAPAS